MDAIQLLEQDHRTVESLFAQFREATDEQRRGEIAKEVIRELSIHACIEEQVFYPFVRETLPSLESEVLEDLEEHHAVETLLAELDRMSAGEERFSPKFTVIAENVKHHVEEEEQHLFPEVRESVSKETLGELGRALAEAKESAPTHPHPHSPQVPPANLVTDKVAAFVDRARDKARAMVGR